MRRATKPEAVAAEVPVSVADECVARPDLTGHLQAAAITPPRRHPDSKLRVRVWGEDR